jgi:hypothetical protein
MVHVRRMNESYFAELLKELNVVGELIRARQEEKQGVLDEFDSESKRFFFGKISEKALASSVKKTNAEISELDREIRKNITRARSISERLGKIASSQAPESYRVTLSGVSERKVKKSKKSKKKKLPKKKHAKKKIKKSKR